MKLPRRVLGILTRPSVEWRIIASEDDDVESIYGGYIAILAAIPGLSMLAGLALAGGRYLGTAGIVTAVTAALVSYAIALAVPFATAVIAEHLAPRFKSDGSTAQALKLVAYASTPFWLAGVCYVFVTTAWLVMLGAAYAVSLLFLGLSPVLGTPAEQRVPLTLVTVMALVAVTTALRWMAAQAGLPLFGF